MWFQWEYSEFFSLICVKVLNHSWSLRTFRSILADTPKSLNETRLLSGELVSDICHGSSFEISATQDSLYLIIKKVIDTYRRGS